MSIDDPVTPDDALLQRYFDGTLDPAEADAFEQRMDREPELADAAARYGALFAALEIRGADAPAPDLAAAVVADWSPAPARGVSGTVGLFLGLDVLLGAALVAVFAARGPTEVVSAWILGLKDIVVAVHGLSLVPEQAALGLVAILGVAILLVGATGYGLGRAFLGGGAGA